MTLVEMERALQRELQDPSLEEFFPAWINNALLELAGDYEFPSLKLRVPYSLAITTANWLYDLPANFHKKLFRCADANYDEIARYRKIDYLDNLDMDHDDTADHPTAVAWVEGDAGNQIGVYPKANDTLYLWYYKKPALLVQPGDIPVCIPESYHWRVIVSKAVLKGFEHLQDQVENFDPKGIQFWQGKVTAGLRGSPVEGIGLVNYLSKIQGGPRRTGGQDPVGARCR